MCIDMLQDKSPIGSVILSFDIFLYIFFTQIWSYRHFILVLDSINLKTLSQNNRIFIPKKTFKSHLKAVLEGLTFKIFLSPKHGGWCYLGKSYHEILLLPVSQTWQVSISIVFICQWIYEQITHHVCNLHPEFIN